MVVFSIMLRWIVRGRTSTNKPLYVIRSHTKKQKPEEVKGFYYIGE